MAVATVLCTSRPAYKNEDRDYNLTCPVCQDVFRDPVLIGCHHTFCRSCIKTWIDERSRRHEEHTPPNKFRCPSCNSINTIPSTGVAGFTKSFYIEQIAEVKSKFQSSYPMCNKHKTEDLRFYCKNCEVPMCRDCKVLKHEGHAAECVADVADEMRAKLGDSIKKAEKDLAKLTTTKTICKQDKECVLKLKQSARNMVMNQVQDMKNAIDNIALKLDHQVCRYFQVYEDDIDKEASEADLNTEALRSFKTVVSQEIRSGSDHSLISNYKGFLANREGIVVKDHKMQNPIYKTKLSNVYNKGTISTSELESMVGAIESVAKTPEKPKKHVQKGSAIPKPQPEKTEAMP